MNREKIHNLKNYLLGTPDRVYTFVSVVLSILSIVFTVITWQFPERVPLLIIIRDITVLSLLLLTSGTLLWKYARREQYLISANANLDYSNKRLSKQFENFHSLVHKFRCDVFSRYKNYIKEDVLVDTKSKATFEKLCHSATTDLKAAFTEFILSTGVDWDDDLCVSVKLTASPDALLSALGNIIDKNKKTSIKKKKKWVYTAYRDPISFEHFRDNREVARAFYSIDGNSAFDHVYNQKHDTYACNDLSALGKTYKNENPRWKEFYNSTILAPIRYNDTANGQYYCFGFIAIDSMNTRKNNLFENTEARHIVGHCADLMAIFFLTLAIVKPEITS